MKNRIVVEVYDGLVQNIYSEDPETTVVVIDCDTDDPDEGEQVEAELEKLSADIDAGRLFHIY